MGKRKAGLKGHIFVVEVISKVHEIAIWGAGNAMY